MNETLILDQYTVGVDNWVWNEAFGAWTATTPKVCELIPGENYRITEGSTAYDLSQAQDISSLIGMPMTAIGDLRPLDFPGDGSMYIIGDGGTFNMFVHTTRPQENPPGNYVLTVHHMSADNAANDAVILNYSQEPVMYQRVPKVWLTHPESTEEAPVLVPFTYGEAVDDVPLELDFSAGNQTVETPEGTLVRSAIIIKPETLVPENIRGGVLVAGITGEFIGDTEEVAVELHMPDGDQIVEPETEGKSLSKVTVKKPMELTAENVKHDVTIGGVTGTYIGDVEEATVELDLLAGDQSIVPTENTKVLSKVTIKRPETLIPQNIVKDVTIAGIVGTHECTGAGGDGSNQLDALFAKTISYASLPNTLALPSQAFSGCSMLSAVYMPKCTQVGSYAFSNCVALASVEMSECERIYARAFTSCSSLTSVDIPKCTAIDGYAFFDCTSLRAVNAPQCASLDYGVFSGCTQLEEVSLGSISQVGLYTFWNCHKLKSVATPVATSIGNSAFYNCYSLTEIVAPSCLSVLSNAFGYCSKLSYISVGRASIMSYAFQYACYDQNVILSGTPYLGSSCFVRCSMREMHVKDYASMWPDAFAYCYRLSKVTFDSGIPWTRTFYYCSALQKAIFPNAYAIGQSAFYQCSKLRMFSGRAVSYISAGAFYACYSLSVVLFTSYTSLTQSLSTAFSYTPLSNSTYLGYYGSIYVPESLVATYKADTYWRTYAARITSITDNILALFD